MVDDLLAEDPSWSPFSSDRDCTLDPRCDSQRSYSLERGNYDKSMGFVPSNLLRKLVVDVENAPPLKNLDKKRRVL